MLAEGTSGSCYEEPRYAKIAYHGGAAIQPQPVPVDDISAAGSVCRRQPAYHSSFLCPDHGVMKETDKLLRVYRFHDPLSQILEEDVAQLARLKPFLVESPALVGPRVKIALLALVQVRPCYRGNLHERAAFNLRLENVAACQRRPRFVEGRRHEAGAHLAMARLTPLEMEETRTGRISRPLAKTEGERASMRQQGAQMHKLLAREHGAEEQMEADLVQLANAVH